MIIKKHEIDTIRFLKKVLNNVEFRDFKALITNEIKVICNGNMEIEFYRNGELAYSMIIDKNVGFNAIFTIDGIGKSYFSLLLKLFENNDFIKLIRQLKKNNEIYFYKNSIELCKTIKRCDSWDFAFKVIHKRIKFRIDKTKKLRIMKVKVIRQ